MDDELRRRTACCPLCQKLRSIKTKPETIISTRSSSPFESVFMDFIGPLRECNGNKHILNMVDRFSHFIVLVPAPTTSARVVVDALFTHWICSFGVPRFITSDGGSAFASEMMSKVTELLNIEHHISAPYHPEGHGAVERANYTVMQTIRALFRGKHDWTTLVRPAAFALNTSYSRVLGTTPFAIVHGFSPRLPINQALDVAPSGTMGDVEDDPLAFSQKLITTAAALFARVRDLQTDIYNNDLAAVRKRSRGQKDYDIGNHVLVHFPRPDKLHPEWRGPYQITEKENEVIYKVTDLVTNDSFRAHVNRLHIFPGNLTPDQLAAESARCDEYYIKTVHGHRRKAGELWFNVKWLGYPALPDTDPEAWVRLNDCRWSPAIRDYRRQHRL
jgi:hypothetical protein